MIYIILILLYSTLIPIAKYFAYSEILVKKKYYGWHLIYLVSIFSCVSFLPILYLNEVNLGLVPQSIFSVIYFILIILIAIIFLKRAIKMRTVIFFGAGFYAGFAEEILFRGVIFGLTFALTQSIVWAVVISSIAFGAWHLKNYPLYGWKNVIFQAIFSGAFYGPVFALLYIWTGDLYLSMLAHVCVDVFHAVSPETFRKYKIAIPYKYVVDDKYIN